MILVINLPHRNITPHEPAHGERLYDVNKSALIVCVCVCVCYRNIRHSQIFQVKLCYSTHVHHFVILFGGKDTTFLYKHQNKTKKTNYLGYSVTAVTRALGLPMSYMRPCRRTPIMPLRLRTASKAEVSSISVM